ncbi:MAG TPA: ABC transporter substrate binding protein [Flexilinea sp.]|nr:ABC transporter substrate binding protein [Flexilinea sp.]
MDKANAKKIPVFGSEIEQVRLGCIAAEGVNYIELGKVTGQMAADVLLGNVKIEDLKYKTIEESNLYINETAAKNLGITLPDSLKQRAVETF